MALNVDANLPDEGFTEAMRLLRSIRAFAIRRRDEMAAGNVPSITIFDVFIHGKQVRAELVAKAAIPGIGEHAKEQFNDPSLDIGAEFNAIIAAIDDLTNSIQSLFPKDASDTYLLAQSWGANGPVDRQFTSAQTATLRTKLQALIDAMTVA